jgi:mRNA-degrading endonuclease RelE of RelBE toxin-antitoxin system
MEKVEEIVKELPPELQQEVEDFVQFLAEKWRRKAGGKLRQDWAGALRDYRDQYTSLELQKKALEWRGD